MTEVNITNNKVVGRFLLFASLIFLGIGIDGYLSTQKFLITGIRTQGIVTDQQYQSDPDGNFYRPIVTYSDSRGIQHQWISDTAYNPAHFQIGQRLDVVYQSQQPDKAIVVDFLDLYLFDLVMAGIGGTILVIALSLLLKKQAISQ